MPQITSRVLVEVWVYVRVCTKGGVESRDGVHLGV